MTAKKFRDLWLVFRALTFINSFFVGITGPLEVIFFLAIGFNPAQIGVLMAAQAIGVLVSDIPTGAFADRYGRKKSLLISFGLLTLIFCLWTATSSYSIFLLLSFFWGVGFAFQSGTKVSLLMDHLPLNDDKQRTRVFSRLAIYGNVGLLVGGVAATLLVAFSLRSIWAAAAMLHVCLFLITLFGIRNDIRQPANEQPAKIPIIFSDALKGVRSYFTVMPFPLLLLLETVTAIILSGYGIIIPIFLRLNWHIQDADFGLLGSLAAAMGIIGALIGERLNRRWGFLATASLFAIILVLLFTGLASASLIIVALTCYALIELLLFGWDPIQQSLINHFLPDDTRTLMLSVSSSTSLIVGSLAQIAIGALLIIIQPQPLIIALGVLFLLWPLVISLLMGYKKIPSLTENKEPPGNH
ncbi:MAG: MFS transporter [Candidatus Komeilibacteria bacterium]